ncbi:MAG TPA: TolC family protein, partial [Bacillota bacterium]|nr:TolC family protein [Bacillota bacterium]
MSVPQRNALFLTVGFLVFFVGMTTCQAETTQKQETLSLNAAVTIAFQNSRQLQIARKELEVAQDKVKQARSGYYPKVNLYGGITRYNNQPTNVELGNQLIALNNGLDAFASGMTQVTSGRQQAYWYGLSEKLSQNEYLDDTLTYYGLKLEIDQPIYTGNRLTAINKQADANVAYAQANLVAVQDNVAFEVRKAYYTVITAQRMAVTIQHAVDDMEQHVKEANDYYKAGFVPKLDVIRAEVKLADLKQKLIMAVNGVNLAKKALNFTLGIDLAKEYIIEDSIDFVPFDQSLEDCQKYALEHRPELTALNYKITMAKENVEIAKSG